MNDKQLRSAVVKLAKDKPELRKVLVPLLKEAAIPNLTPQAIVWAGLTFTSGAMLDYQDEHSALLLTRMKMNIFKALSGPEKMAARQLATKMNSLAGVGGASTQDAPPAPF